MNNLFENWTITSIKSIEIYDTGEKLTKRNKPDNIQVSEREMRIFCKDKRLNYSFSEVAELITYKDKYGNIVAGIILGRKKNKSDTKYFINPELYKLGQQRKKYIKDEYAKVRPLEKVMTLNDIKSVKI